MFLVIFLFLLPPHFSIVPLYFCFNYCFQEYMLFKNNLTIARGELGGDSGERGLQELL